MRIVRACNAPLIDNGAPTFFVTGKEAEYLGNGLVSNAYYRLQRSGGECRVVEFRMIFHMDDLAAMRVETDKVIQAAFGNDRRLM